MKLTLDNGRRQFNLFVGLGFLMFVFRKKLKKYFPERGEIKKLKKLLKKSRRQFGHYTLLEVYSDDCEITVRI